MAQPTQPKWVGSYQVGIWSTAMAGGTEGGTDANVSFILPLVWAVQMNIVQNILVLIATSKHCEV